MGIWVGFIFGRPSKFIIYKTFPSFLILRNFSKTENKLTFFDFINSEAEMSCYRDFKKPGTLSLIQEVKNEQRIIFLFLF